MLEVLTKIYSVLINSSHSIWKIASAERMWGEKAGSPAPLVPEGHTHQVHEPTLSLSTWNIRGRIRVPLPVSIRLRGIERARERPLLDRERESGARSSPAPADDDFDDRLRVGTSLGGVPREQKMLKGHQPRIMYHQVY